MSALAFEDRLKLTPTFALIGGIRVEEIELARTAYRRRTAFCGPPTAIRSPRPSRRLPAASATPGKRCPALTFYSQYATAADPTVANIFNLRPTKPLLLTTSRIYETGVKLLFWDKRAEWTFSAFDIERKNVYVPESGMLFNVAGKIASKGFEIAGAINPIGGLKLWGNVAFVRSRFANFDYIDGNGVAAVLFRQYAAQCAELRRQCRRVLPLRHGVAGRDRRLGPPCRRPLQLPG